jgi:hypothetical protein
MSKGEESSEARTMSGLKQRTRGDQAHEVVLSVDVPHTGVDRASDGTRPRVLPINRQISRPINHPSGVLLSHPRGAVHRTRPAETAGTAQTARTSMKWASAQDRDGPHEPRKPAETPAAPSGRQRAGANPGNPLIGKSTEEAASDGDPRRRSPMAGMAGIGSVARPDSGALIRARLPARPIMSGRVALPAP